MNNIELINNKIQLDTISTREVAEMIGVRHDTILTKLEGSKNCKTKGIIPTLTDHEILVSDYFIESTYKDNSGKSNKEYLCTKIGCDFLGNKYNGEKGIIFTAKYVKRFEEMKQIIAKDSFMIENPELRCKVWLQEQQQRQLLLEKNEILLTEMKDKDTIIDVFIESEGLYSLGLIGKVLKKHNDSLGRNGIFSYLRNEKVLMDCKGTMKHNLPYATFDKYFAIKLRGLNPVTFVTKDGIKWLVKRLNKQGLINIDNNSVMNEIEKQLEELNK
ncbi:Rha family transcriptional regulator [Romboutsia sedimentorum]|uniref:Rha family transcriptional regulator n=1 Tax=Romboutsia sedimentorum TaxID=1368474 RepID=UPI0024DEBCD1|nr:Rha family transcriptional regulator [Romboutsia sedimentorum]MDK2587564.1 Rha family transcriptional regulator [Romboutsia sedimentorum]